MNVVADSRNGEFMEYTIHQENIDVLNGAKPGREVIQDDIYISRTGTPDGTITWVKVGNTIINGYAQVEENTSPPHYRIFFNSQMIERLKANNEKSAIYRLVSEHYR